MKYSRQLFCFLFPSVTNDIAATISIRLMIFFLQVKAMCRGKSSCNIVPTTPLFNMTCPGWRRLWIIYSCDGGMDVTTANIPPCTANCPKQGEAGRKGAGGGILKYLFGNWCYPRFRLPSSNFLLISTNENNKITRNIVFINKLSWFLLSKTHENFIVFCFIIRSEHKNQPKILKKLKGEKLFVKFFFSQNKF